MSLAALRREAAAELCRLVEEEGGDFPALGWLWSALRAKGKLLAPEAGFCWGLLPPVVAEGAGGDPRLALPLSAAVECFIAAADTLDDVQDADAADALWRACGIATATNVATLLLFLTQLGIGRLSRHGVPDGKVAEIMRIFAAAGARACGGQQRDLDQGSGEGVDEAWYLAMIAQKSASLVEAICRSAALLAGAPPGAIEAYARFGSNLGMALQISNDVAAATPRGKDRNDLHLGKRTLPIIFALEQAPAAERAELAALIARSQRDGLRAEEVDRVSLLLGLTGSLQYATVVGDVYWERALMCLDEIGERKRRLIDLLAQVRQVAGAAK